jgi:hypothetical protein
LGFIFTSKYLNNTKRIRMRKKEEEKEEVEEVEEKRVFKMK